MEQREISDGFVHVYLLSVRTHQVAQVVEQIRGAVAAASQLPGFLSVTVLLSSDSTRIAVLSEWQREADWAHAEWDARMQDALVELYASCERMDSHTYAKVMQVVKGTPA